VGFGDCAREAKQSSSGARVGFSTDDGAGGEAAAVGQTAVSGSAHVVREPERAAASSAAHTAPRLHILRVQTHEVSRKDEKVRWCFKCRKHLMHELVVRTPDDPMSYYGPHAALECVGCHEDNADFPGTFRDGPRYDYAV
jgi:hypothetical protein